MEKEPIDIGFLERSAGLYNSLASRVLQVVIGRKLEASSGAVLTKEALTNVLSNVSDEGDRGACSAFLKAHENESLDRFMAQMDVTVCCYYLLYSGSLQLTQEEKDAVHAIRIGRNITQHSVDTGVRQSGRSMWLWLENREALRRLCTVFPRYVEPEIKAQIEAYYEGTAGEYLPPVSSCRKRLQAALERGDRIDSEVRTLLTIQSRLKEAAPECRKVLCEFAPQYKDAYRDYIQRGLDSSSSYDRERARALSDMVQRSSASLAWQHLDTLGLRDGLEFLALCAAGGTLPRNEALAAACRRIEAMHRTQSREEVLAAADDRAVRRAGWQEPLFRHLTELTAGAERRFWVREGLGRGCDGLWPLFLEEQAQQTEELAAMDWSAPSFAMEQLAAAQQLPEEIRTLLTGLEEKQVLARLAQWETLPLGEQLAAWNACQRGAGIDRAEIPQLLETANVLESLSGGPSPDGPMKSPRGRLDAYRRSARIVHSDIPRVQEAVRAFGDRLAEACWSRYAQELSAQLDKPFSPEQLALVRSCWQADETGGGAFCAPGGKDTAFLSRQVPGYARLQEVWTLLRAQCSRSCWQVQRLRAEEAAALPFGPEKMTIAVQEADFTCLDRPAAEYGAFRRAWDAFCTLRTREYWQWERARIDAVCSQPYSASRPLYARETRYDALLVPDAEGNAAWREAFDRYEQNVRDGRYQAEADRLRAMAAGWKELAAQLNAFSEPIRDIMAQTAKAAQPDEADLDRLRKALAGLPAKFTGAVSPWDWLDQTWKNYGEGHEPERQAFLDLRDEIRPACSAMGREAQFPRDLRRSIDECKARLQAAQQESERRQRARARAKVRVRRVLTAAVIVAALAAVVLGGRAAAIKAAAATAEKRAEAGQFIEAYRLLDRTAFLGGGLEEQRRELLGQIRLELLQRGYRDELLSQALTDSCAGLARGTALEGRTDVELVPSDTVLVYREAGTDGYRTLLSGNPMELRIPAGLTLRSVWGEVSGHVIDLCALCTDGTLLRGTFGWTFETQYAEKSWYDAQYAQIARDGLDLTEDGRLEGVRMYLRGGLCWMEDGRVLEGEKCLWRDVVGFLPDSYGAMDLSRPIRSDGRWAQSENDDRPDVWETQWPQTVLTDGRVYDDAARAIDKALGNDMLFPGLSVYDGETARWLRE